MCVGGNLYNPYIHIVGFCAVSEAVHVTDEWMQDGGSVLGVEHEHVSVDAVFQLRTVTKEVQYSQVNTDCPSHVAVVEDVLADTDDNPEVKRILVGRGHSRSEAVSLGGHHDMSMVWLQLLQYRVFVVYVDVEAWLHGNNTSNIVTLITNAVYHLPLQKDMCHMFNTVCNTMQFF